MKNKMKVFCLSLGVMAMSFAFFVGKPSSAKANMAYYVCCKSDSSGCTDSGGGDWPSDEKRSTKTCTR